MYTCTQLVIIVNNQYCDVYIMGHKFQPNCLAQERGLAQERRLAKERGFAQERGLAHEWGLEANIVWLGPGTCV